MIRALAPEASDDEGFRRASLWKHRGCHAYQITIVTPLPDAAMPILHRFLMMSNNFRTVILSEHCCAIAQQAQSKDPYSKCDRVLITRWTFARMHSEWDYSSL